VQQETTPRQDKPSKELLQARAQLEEVASRISQLEARLQSVRILGQPNSLEG